MGGKRRSGCVPLGPLYQPRHLLAKLSNHVLIELGTLVPKRALAMEGSRTKPLSENRSLQS